MGEIPRDVMLEGIDVDSAFYHHMGWEQARRTEQVLAAADELDEGSKIFQSLGYAADMAADPTFLRPKEEPVAPVEVEVVAPVRKTLLEDLDTDIGISVLGLFCLGLRTLLGGNKPPKNEK